MSSPRVIRMDARDLRPSDVYYGDIPYADKSSQWVNLDPDPPDEDEGREVDEVLSERGRGGVRVRFTDGTEMTWLMFAAGGVESELWLTHPVWASLGWSQS